MMSQSVPAKGARIPDFSAFLEAQLVKNPKLGAYTHPLKRQLIELVMKSIQLKQQSKILYLKIFLS